MDETVEHEKIHRISPSPPPERERPPDSEHCSAKRMDRGSTEDADCSGGGSGGSRPGPRVNGAGAPAGGGRGSPEERAGPAPGAGAPSTAIPTTTTAGVKIKQEPKEGDMKVSVLISVQSIAVYDSPESSLVLLTCRFLLLFDPGSGIRFRMRFNAKSRLVFVHILSSCLTLTLHCVVIVPLLLLLSVVMVVLVTCHLKKRKAPFSFNRVCLQFTYNMENNYIVLSWNNNIKIVQYVALFGTCLLRLPFVENRGKGKLRGAP